MKLAIRPNTGLGASHLLSPLRPLASSRRYATQHGLGTTASSPAPRRRSVTPFNDDGHVPWHQLSAAEKTARATQQTFNLGLMIAGLALTAGVGYFLYTDVFSPDSKTAYFNRAVDRIKKDPECLAVLGDSKHIEAHGDATMNKWRRARPIASSHTKDARGNEHLVIHFYVHGPLNRGSVNVELVKRAGTSNFEYKYFFVDVPGHSRITLENADLKPNVDGKKYKLFGVSWN